MLPPRLRLLLPTACALLIFCSEATAETPLEITAAASDSPAAVSASRAEMAGLLASLDTVQAVFSDGIAEQIATQTVLPRAWAARDTPELRCTVSTGESMTCQVAQRGPHVERSLRLAHE